MNYGEPGKGRKRAADHLLCDRLIRMADSVHISAEPDRIGVEAVLDPGLFGDFNAPLDPLRISSQCKHDAIRVVAAVAITFGPVAAASIGIGGRPFMMRRRLADGAFANSSSAIGGATVDGISISSNETSPPDR